MATTRLNKNALRIFEKIEERRSELHCSVVKSPNGATLLDAGINVPGSSEAGRLIGEICLGGLGEIEISDAAFGGVTLRAARVTTNSVMVSTLCSQYAGWTVKVEKYFAMASGPARALARVENLFEELKYKEDSDVAVIVLETRELPPDNVTKHIADKCGVPTSNLHCVVAPTACLAGSVQISARVVEVGVHKLHALGFDPSRIKRGHGVAPIAPVAKSDGRAMGATNDCILYGGSTFYDVEASADDNWDDLIRRVPSSASAQYGTPFYDLFKSVGFDFYKVDPLLFSPAEVTINDLKRNRTYNAGAVNVEVLRRSLGL